MLKPVAGWNRLLFAFKRFRMDRIDRSLNKFRKIYLTFHRTVFFVERTDYFMERSDYWLERSDLEPASSSGASFFAWQRRARNEWLVMNHKGPWEGYKRQAKRRLARCLLPAFLCAHIFIKRETSGYEADLERCQRSDHGTKWPVTAMPLADYRWAN